MSETQSAARDAGEPMDQPPDELRRQWQEWTNAAAEAMDAGHAPSSPAGQALASSIAESMGKRPAEAAAAIETSTDTRAERYWQLMATINGWPQWPSQVPRAEWIITALRALG